jgi:error-prone DNA polymerase
LSARLALVEGRVQSSKEGVVHVIANAVFDRSHELGRLSDTQVMPLNVASVSEPPKSPRQRNGGHPRDLRILPKSRDFH